MGKWKGDSNPGGPGGRTQRIRSKQGSGAHKKGDGCLGSVVMAVSVVVTVGATIVEAVR